MAKWIKAADVPLEWAGRQAWQFNEWGKNGVFLTFIPETFSRAPGHCHGVWFKLQPTPQPPRIKGNSPGQ